MIIIGEKINGSIPSVAEAIANRDAEFIKQRALAQANSGASYIDCCASVPETEEVETLKWMIDLVQEVTDTPICVDSPSARSCVAAIMFDAKASTFSIISGDSDSLCYVNGEALYERKVLVGYEQIELGDSERNMFVFVPLCGEQFSWISYQATK